jgi:tRNA nucleotidyltransferase (CCA-adding enzyme)
MTWQCSFSEIKSEVLRRVLPSQEDRIHLKKISEDIISRIEHLAALQALSLKAMLVGSAARDTWLSGDHDLDIFLGVPIDGSLDAALEIARIVAPEHEEKYAEHAYVHARVNGFDVDLVPCYLVEDASKLKSAVDRTPFHTKYVARKIVGLEGDVLLLKQFLKGVGVYGSELRVGGFSGYLSELLVIRYGSFPKVLRAAKCWRPGEFIDLEGRGSRAHEEPLVVVDPVDPGRNVAAALTLDKMFQFVAASRCFLAEPCLDFFFPKPMSPISDEELQAQINVRGSSLILVLFHSPPVVEDVLFPQLRKAEESVNAMMERNGFSLLRSDVGSFRDMAVMLFEMEVWELSKVCRRTGPPVWEEEHLSRFLAAHTHPLFGPYIREGKVVVEEPRKYTHACDLLAAEIGNLSLGKHLSKAIREAHDIYVGSELVGIDDDDLRIFLAHYFQAEKKIG